MKTPVDADTHANETAGAARSGAVKAAAAWIVLPSFFLATGGSLRWWEAWAYCLVLLVPMTAFLVRAARRDPESLARRMKLQENDAVQRRIVAGSGVFLVLAFLVPGLDRRFGWSHPPPAVVVAALAIVLVSYLLVLKVLVVNRWAGRTIETYPGQQVVATGPYAIVRHPMYSGAAALYLASPVALGSWWGLLPAAAAVLFFVPRILNEEEVLLRELPGYAGYRRAVGHRLVPFVW